MERSWSDGLLWGPAANLPVAAQGTKGRVLYGGLVLSRKSQLHEAEKVLEHLGVALNTRLPVFVNATLKNLLSVGYLAWMRFGVVVVCLASELLEVT